MRIVLFTLLIFIFAVIPNFMNLAAFAATQSIEVPPLQNRILFIPLKVGESLNVHYTAAGGSTYVILEDGNGNTLSEYDSDMHDVSFTFSPNVMDGDYKIILENTSIASTLVTLDYELSPPDPTRTFALNSNGTIATIMSGILLIIIGAISIGLVTIFILEKVLFRKEVLNET